MSLKQTLSLENDDLVVIGSKSGNGKTRLLMATAQEYVDADKRVAVITDDKLDIWTKAMKTPSEADLGTLSVFSYDETKSIAEILGNKKYDVLIVDVINYEKKDLLKELRVFGAVSNCITFTSMQLKESFVSREIAVGYTIMQTADCVCSISRIMEYKWYMRVLYFLLPFWFKKPNRTIKVLKNRRGKPTSFDVNIDFEKAKIS